jgi:hypothetical protein
MPTIVATRGGQAASHATAWVSPQRSRYIPLGVPWLLTGTEAAYNFAATVAFAPRTLLGEVQPFNDSETG